ncbi:MAG: SEL1-like repeat protein [Deltaproteobacteria bacterium]|nr:SEL1-like repeat protein [Deltaproteobacteria bacterium]
MKRIAILSIFVVALAAPVYADFSSGLDAFLNEDYRKALGEFRPLAEQGNADAQYMLGHMYAAGKGVLQDYVLAHKWFNLAAALGNAKAATARDKIAQVMTTGQIAEAQKLAREWTPKQVAEKPATAAPPAPAETVPSDSDLIRAIQDSLAGLGYDPGPVDGKMGSRTRNAIKKYQAETDLPVNGEVSQALLEHLRETLEKGGIQHRAAKAPTKPSTAPEQMAGIAAPDEQTQAFLDELKQIVEAGAKGRKADPDFINGLRDMIRRYLKRSKKAIRETRRRRFLMCF